VDVVLMLIIAALSNTSLASSHAHGRKDPEKEQSANIIALDFNCAATRSCESPAKRGMRIYKKPTFELAVTLIPAASPRRFKALTFNRCPTCL
jgi:hypothetical protein